MNTTLKQKIVILLNNWTTFGKWNEEMKKELASQLLSLFEAEKAEQVKAIEGLEKDDNEHVIGADFEECEHCAFNQALSQVLSILTKRQ